jgi:outer membrane protein assembly factor BamB
MKKCLASIIAVIILIPACLSDFSCAPLHKLQPSKSPVQQDQQIITQQLTEYRKTIAKQIPFKTVLWEAILPGEKVKSVYLVSELLCIETESQKLYAIKADSGLRQWQAQINAPIDFGINDVTDIPKEIIVYDTKEKAKLNELEDELSNKNRSATKIDDLKKEIVSAKEMLKTLRIYDRLYFTANNNLFCLDRLTGNTLWKKNLTFVPQSKPVATILSVFIGALDWNRVYQFDTTQLYERTWYKADGPISNQMTYSKHIIFFASSDGVIHAYNDETGEEKWQYKTQGLIRGAITLDDGVLYAGSNDSTLYALDEHIGKLLWKFECGVPIINQPLILQNNDQAGKSIYFNTYNDGLYALDLVNTSTKGSRGDDIIIPHCVRRWKFMNANQVLTRIGHKLYLINTTGNKTLYEVNDLSGETEASYALKPFEFYLSSPDGSIIYLTTSDGYMFALKK